MCKSPYVAGLAAYGCGQCLPCRINRRRMWTHRIILEALCHADNAFVTLTYDPEQLLWSEGYKNGLPTLWQDDLTRWLKRFRKEISPLRVRYFAVGEYSDTGRPHYHLAVFGYPGCFKSLLPSHDPRNCDVCGPIHYSWGHGRIHVGILSLDSAAYVAGYVTKKMTGKDDARLLGRLPEFATQSRIPGLGRNALFEVADTRMKFDLEDDVSRLRHGKKVMPLGRYLTQQLRVLCDKSPQAPTKVLETQKEALQPMREAAEVYASAAPAHVRREIFRAKFAELITEHWQGRVAQLEARYGIFSKRERL